MKNLIYIFLALLIASCNLSPNPDYKEPSSDYKEVEISPQVYINQLDNFLVETSGLLNFSGLIWSLNDSGNKNEIYAFNNSGQIITTVELAGVENNDWEALAQDETYIYVGDFGNNSGSRTNLAVYRIKKSDLSPLEPNMVVTPETIGFSYSEQSDFSDSEYMHEFDCEAMFVHGDYLYLFTKDWKNFKTSVYRLSKTPGDYEISALGSYDTNGLITGADIPADGNYFALVGYQIGGINYLVPFVYLFEFDEVDIFSQKSILFNLRSIGGSQTEGVVFLNDNELVISTEKTESYVQQVFSINIENYFSHFH